MRVAIYTSIFGGYDDLIDDQFKMNGVDYICFTDMDIKSDTWNIVKSTPIYSDANRNAKKYKILPHRYLSDYDYSLWIDGNILIRKDVTPLIDKHPYQVYDHNQTRLDPRDCIYDEYNAIIQLGQQNGGNFKDNPQLMYNQLNRYQRDGYPQNNGLATNPIILRNHNDDNVIQAMETWWNEIKHNSRRDQLSFDYIAWKTQFNYVYLKGDSRNNEYFLQTGKHKGNK